MMRNTLELFSGAGGMALGLELAGYSCKGLVEFEPNACNTLRQNFSAPVHEGDVRDLDFKDFAGGIDIVAGGPPCQPFSAGGKARGHQDARDMFPQAIRAINDLQPKFFIFENVKGLLRQSFSSYLEYILLRLTYPTELQKVKETWIDHLSRLEKLKSSGSALEQYKVVFRLLNAADYGVPQKRERVFIVGIRSDLNVEWSFPDPTHCSDALKYSKYVTRQYWDERSITPPKDELEIIKLGDVARRLEKRFGMIPPARNPWRTVRDAIDGLSEPDVSENSAHNSHILKKGARSYPGHTGSPLDLPSKALKAGVHGVPGGENTLRLPNGSVRYFTVREAARIQTFPDHFKFAGAWGENMRQLGNAVPVKLAQFIGSSLSDAMKASRS